MKETYSENPTMLSEPISTDDDDGCGETCTFCVIAKGDCPYTEILFEDEEVVCFQDINPGAVHHYLVIPKNHIHSCKSLEAEDISLVKKMAKVGRAVLKAKNVTDFKDIGWKGCFKH